MIYDWQSRSSPTLPASLTLLSTTLTSQSINTLNDRRPENLAMWVLVKNCCSYGGILDSSDMKGDVPERWLLHAIMRALHRIYDRGTGGMFNHGPGAFTQSISFYSVIWITFRVYRPAMSCSLPRMIMKPSS
jgi:hypothetical protein